MSTLTPERWQQVSPYLDQALALSAEERAAWLETLRAQKPQIAEFLEELLNESQAAVRQQFLERGAGALVNETSLTGQTIGAYRLLSPIGQGGMGSVWLAERSDGRFERRVAVKFLRFSVAGRGSAERFKREGAILGQLAHPHIAELIDAGITPSGEPYLVLEHVEGQHIDEYCDARKLDLETRIRLFLDVLSAVAHAHANLIVHRDLKPSNVLVRSDGQVKLLDFGIAKLLAEDAAAEATLLTIEGGGALTPQFAAPEQITGAPMTTATDVYALGVLLYLLLTGEHPAGPGNHSTADLVKAIVDTEPRRASEVAVDSAAELAAHRATTSEKLRRQLRGDLDTILAKALKKNPVERYGSVTAFGEDLQRYLRHEPISARPDTVAYRARKFIRRNRLTVALTAFALLALIAGVTGTLIQARTARHQRDAALRERDRANRIAEFMTGIFKVSDPNERVGKAVTARELLDKAAGEITTNLSKDPELQAQLLRVMGRAYLNIGFFAKAESLFREQIQTSKSFGAEHSRETLLTTHDMAWAVLQQGRLAEAEGIERELLETQRKILGPQDPDTLATVEELAFTVCNEGKGHCAEGIALTREVLEKQKRSLGPEAFYTLATMNNLAIMLAADGRLDEAISVQQDSLDKHRHAFGLENIGTVNAMLELGEFQRDAGREDDALHTLQELLAIENRALGPDQVETATTKYDLASVLVRRGQRKQALSLLQQALDHGLAPRTALGLATDPLFTSLHGDRRFTALLASTAKRYPENQRN